MLGAAAAGEADPIAFADAQLEEVVGQTVRAQMEVQERERSLRVDDGELLGKALRVSRE